MKMNTSFRRSSPRLVRLSKLDSTSTFNRHIPSGFSSPKKFKLEQEQEYPITKGPFCTPVALKQQSKKARLQRTRPTKNGRSPNKYFCRRRSERFLRRSERLRLIFNEKYDIPVVFHPWSNRRSTSISSSPTGVRKTGLKLKCLLKSPFVDYYRPRRLIKFE